jgi:hypothetical protein
MITASPTAHSAMAMNADGLGRPARLTSASRHISAKSTVDRTRAQDRPWRFFHAIHSHSSVTTRPPKIEPPTKALWLVEVDVWLTTTRFWSAMPETMPWMRPMAAPAYMSWTARVIVGGGVAA